MCHLIIYVLSYIISVEYMYRFMQNFTRYSLHHRPWTQFACVRIFYFQLQSNKSQIQKTLTAQDRGRSQLQGITGVGGLMFQRDSENDSGFGGPFLGSLTDSVLDIGVSQLEDSHAIDEDLAISAIASFVRDLDHSRA